MNSGETRESQEDHQPSRPDFAEAIEGLLSRLSPNLAEAIRLGAVPHRLNSDLLASLLGDQADIQSLLMEMRRLDLLRETESGWLVYHDQMRTHLLVGLRNQPAVYRQASALAAEYFRQRYTTKENPNRDRDLLEYIYHLFAANEAVGLNELRHYFTGFQHANQTGLADQLITYTLEQEYVLSQPGREWLYYFRIQINQTDTSSEKKQKVFRELAERAADPLLQASARRSLGQNLAQSWQWFDSIVEFQAALQAFKKLGNHLEIANTQADLGMLFVSLSEATGGLREKASLLETHWIRGFFFLQHAPFLAYRWLSRRFAFLPNMYFGNDYQNWIIIRYLYNAIGWFKRSERTLELGDEADKAARSLSRTYICIRLADLYHRVGRWSVAERYLAALAQDPNVSTNPYLQSLVSLTHCDILLSRGDTRQTIQSLQECRVVFSRYGDLNSDGKAARLEGQAYARLGEFEVAVQAYQAAMQGFYRTDDLLNATETRIIAQTLADGLLTGTARGFQETNLSGEQTRQIYIERFPNGPSGFMQRLFRGLAISLALPLTYLLAVLIALSGTLLVGATELLFAVVLKSVNWPVLLTDLAIALPSLFFLPLLILWVYEGIYVTAGVLVIHFLRFGALSLHRSDYFMLDNENIVSYDQKGRLIHSLPWSKVTITASLDWSMRDMPIALFSRFLVGNEEKAIIIEGILNHYVQFKQEVGKCLRVQSQPVRSYRLDFSLLDRCWTLATLGVTGLMVIIYFILNMIHHVPCSMLVGAHGLDEGQCLYITAVVFQFWKWLIFIGPLFVLIHLLHNRRKIRRFLGNRVGIGATWPVWMGLLIFLAMTILTIIQMFSF